MKQTILIHGRPDEDELLNSDIPSPSNSHWFPWLQKQLAMREELSQALEFPFRNREPFFGDWSFVFGQVNATERDIFIGHSTGAGFLLRYLSEHKKLKPEKIILVAPWIDPEKTLTTDFFSFVFDEHLTDRIEVHIFISSDDEDSILESVKTIKEKLSSAILHEFSDKGHFCQKDFPELLEILK